MLPGNEFNNIKLPDFKMVLTAEPESVDTGNVTHDVHYLSRSMSRFFQSMFLKLVIISQRVMFVLSLYYLTTD